MPGVLNSGSVQRHEPVDCVVVDVINPSNG